MPHLKESKNTRIKYKCPFHYIGSKAKLLGQILPIIDSYQPDVLIDLFAGGFSVGVSCSCSDVVYNDANYLFEALIELLYKSDKAKFLSSIQGEVKKRNLSKTNKEAYEKLRSDYNKTKDPILLYLLISYSFNHQMRFNHTGDFNTPFGKNRSYLSSSTIKDLNSFIDKLKSKKIIFCSKDFEDVKPIDGKKCLFFVDPPYLLSTGSYNDGNRGLVSWNDEKEKRLYDFLDKIDNEGCAFVLTNFISSGKTINQYLSNFSKKYKTKLIKSSYKNSNYHKKSVEQEEIIVRNF